MQSEERQEPGAELWRTARKGSLRGTEQRAIQRGRSRRAGPTGAMQGVSRTRRWSEQVLLDATMKTPQYPSGFCNTKKFFFLREFINTVSVGWQGPKCQLVGSGRVTGKGTADMRNADNYFKKISSKWGRQEARWRMGEEDGAGVSPFQIGKTCNRSMS